MDGDGALAFVTVGRESAQVDDVAVGEQLSGVQPIEEFVVVGEDRFDAGRMHELETQRPIIFVAVDPRRPIAPEGARDHQMVHQIETRGVGVGLLDEVVAGVLVLSFAAFFGSLVEVHGQRSDRLGEYPDAGPHRREVQRTLLGDVGQPRGIGDGVGRDDFVDRRLELGGGHAPLITAMYKRKPLHQICFGANLIKWCRIAIRQCLDYA